MSITLKKTEDLISHVERTLHSLFVRLRALLPDVEMHHIGATALPVAMTKGDIDVLLSVVPARFPAVVDVLKQHFEIKQPLNWTPEFASFGDDTSYDLPVGVQVVIRDSSADFLLFLRDYFLAHPGALEEYNRVKVANCDGSPEKYWKAKDEFLAKILTSKTK
jgi:GrpB-like predicted nucleotidyltransferase (UPF0157 family)